MDHRAHPRSETGRLSHRSKDRDDYSRYSHQDREQSYPRPPPREGDRHWAHPDAHYGAHYSSPAARQPQYPHHTQQYSYSYGPPDHQRPQSRHGYDYPAHSHWDYRDNYTYYDQDYYRGQQGPQDAGQWVPQDLWRTEPYHERTSKQEHPGSYNTEEYRNDRGRDDSQHYLKHYEDNPSKENEEVSSYYLGTLSSSKNSGLSSSCCELSQYINGAEAGDQGPPPAHTSEAELPPVHHMSAPLKYSVPHAVVSFGPAGQLIRVTPGFSTQENVSQLEIHSLEVILSETKEHQDMRNFPGPLTREDLHKVDAIEFAQQRAAACTREDQLVDRSSAALLWKLLILLCRQNGQIVGSDIAELLMQGSDSEGNWEPEAPTLIDFSEGTTTEAPPSQGDDLLTGTGSSSEPSGKALQSYTQLLLAGRKKEALESAMSSGLWGHALFLASKMDNRSYTNVLNRFTGQLTASDPLQTLFQLLSGRIPTAATSCGNDKWGNWRPHLAVMLSNDTGDHAVQQRAIVTMGDTLASRGLLHAAHVCYLTASVPFGAFTQKEARMVLLGSSHSRSFGCFATNFAIQCTELFEYCQTLGGKSASIPSFQVYKFLYASRLLDCGLASQAFHYCEVVGQAILRLKEPLFVLTGEVVKLADRLRHTEAQFSEAAAGGAGQEPDWLTRLRARHHGLQCHEGSTRDRRCSSTQEVEMGSSDCTETHQLPPEGHSSVNDDDTIPESDMDDLRSDVQSPEPELLYYRGPEDQHTAAQLLQERNEEMTAQERPQANTWMPVPMVNAPPVSAVAASPDFSYHNTDSAEVGADVQYCPQSDLQAAAAQGAGLSSGSDMTWGQVPGVDVSQPGQMQPSILQSSEASEPTDEAPQQSTKPGWFSGWFKTKSKEAQKDNSAKQDGPAPTLPPTTSQRPPPPPAHAPPGMFPSQPSSAGINPFSRKAGQQLG